MSSYQALDATKIVETLQHLEARITRRFPAADLGAVCRSLIEIGESTQKNAEAIAAPNWLLRGGAGVVVLAVLSSAVFAWVHHPSLKPADAFSLFKPADAFAFFEGVDAVIHITVVIGAAFLLDDRLKRRRALRKLHAFRSIAHVIDMHQLSKDPGTLLGDDRPDGVASQPGMTPPDLTRYLDYCSEMLSLTSKLAALYAQVLPDVVVIDTVNEIENLTANLSRKIWQKISIVESFAALAPVAAAEIEM